LGNLSQVTIQGRRYGALPGTNNRILGREGGYEGIH